MAAIRQKRAFADIQRGRFEHEVLPTALLLPFPTIADSRYDLGPRSLVFQFTGTPSSLRILLYVFPSFPMEDFS